MKIPRLSGLALVVFGCFWCRLAQVQAESAQDPQNAALLAFKREQITVLETFRKNPLADQDAIEEYLKLWNQRANVIEQTQGDAAVNPASILQERAYFAPSDGSAQPYWVVLPIGYTPAKKWPLVVFLHGYSTGITKATPWIPSLPTLQFAQKNGFVFVVPYGRRNSDFVQWGEDDLLAVRAEVERLYSIDTNREFLLGASMGGYGAHAAGLHTAGQWAAIAPISGRTDFYLWFKTQRDSLPPWKRILYDADDPRTLIANARATPFLIQHGALDYTVPVAHSRLFAADAHALGLPVKYEESPYEGHESDFQVPAFEKALVWFKTQPSLAPPRAFSVVAGDLREAKVYWGQIEAFEEYGQMSRLDVALEANVLSVQIHNVASFRLDVPPEFWPQNAPLQLKVDGQPVTANFEKGQPIVWTAPRVKGDKTPQKVGPFKNLLRDPFLLVYGNDLDKAAAQKFANEWSAWTDGTATLKADNQITTDDCANFNLLLFGTRATNSLLEKIADQLPLELTPTGYRRGQTQIEAPNLGLRIVWKSPWNENRLIGVCSGAWWGTFLPLNHKWDLIPDYIVYDTRFEKDDTNRALEAGFFDGNWEFEPSGKTD